MMRLGERQNDRQRRTEMFALLAILAVALLLRLRGLSAGLPALWDADEPFFVLSGLELLRDQTLNPHWFGHPGTQTIYALAIVHMMTIVGGMISGAWVDTASFMRSIYHDPTPVFLPGRVFVMLCGVASVGLTHSLAKRLFDWRIGLLAAALLAIDPIHIRYSQIIRTDVQVTLYLLLGLLAALTAARRGRIRDFILAGVAVGFCCATKWPAVTLAVAVIGAAALRAYEQPGERKHLPRNLAIAGLAAVVGLFVASPYLLLDFGQVLTDLRGEGRPVHLGATGGGPLANAWWYLANPFFLAFGAAGLALAFGGMALAAQRSREFACVILPVIALMFLLLIAQNLRWERWVVPLLPVLAISAAVAASVLLDRFGKARIPAAIAVAGLLFVPPILTAQAQAQERLNDTRALATRWAAAHIPAGSSIVIEYMAFDVVDQPWRWLYPVGKAGCIDARAALSGRIRLNSVGRMRGKSRPIIDLGAVPAEAAATCRADYVITINYDRYRAEGDRWPENLANYARIMAGGRTVALFAPRAGEVGGPVVRIVAVPRPAVAVATVVPRS